MTLFLAKRDSIFFYKKYKIYTVVTICVTLMCVAIFNCFPPGFEQHRMTSSNTTVAIARSSRVVRLDTIFIDRRSACASEHFLKSVRLATWEFRSLLIIQHSRPFHNLSSCSTRQSALGDRKSLHDRRLPSSLCPMCIRPSIYLCLSLSVSVCLLMTLGF